MSDLAHKLLAALEHAGIGGAGVKELADEHLPAVDPETGVRPATGKAASSSSSSSSSPARKRAPRKSRSSASKPATKASTSTSDAG